MWDYKMIVSDLKTEDWVLPERNAQKHFWPKGLGTITHRGYLRPTRGTLLPTDPDGSHCTTVQRCVALETNKPVSAHAVIILRHDKLPKNWVFEMVDTRKRALLQLKLFNFLAFLRRGSWCKSVVHVCTSLWFVSLFMGVSSCTTSGREFSAQTSRYLLLECLLVAFLHVNRWRREFWCGRFLFCCRDLSLSQILGCVVLVHTLQSSAVHV